MSPKDQTAYRARKSVVRACDQCHKRRVKCDGNSECARCRRTRTECTYLNPVRPKGPTPRSQLKSREEYGTSKDDNKSTTHMSGSQPSRTGTPKQGLPEIDEKSQMQMQENDMDFWQEDPSPGNYHHGMSNNAAKGGPSMQQQQQQGQEDIVSPSNPLEGYISQDWLDDAWLSQLLPPQQQQQQPLLTGQNMPSISAQMMSSQQDLAQGSGTSHHDENNAGAMMMMMDQGTFTLDPRQVACAPIVDSRWAVEQMPDTGAAGTSNQNAETSQLGAIASDPLYQQRSFEPINTVMYGQREPQSTSFGPSPIVRLAIDSLILPQIALFFKRIHPMIPVFSPAYIYEKIAIQTHHTDSDFCAMLLALTSLTLIHPLAPEERAGKDGRREHAKMLLAEACRLRDAWDFGVRSQFSAAMTSYFMFGALFELGQAEAARMRLREALSLGEIMNLHRKEGYDLGDPLEAQRRLRLFWVLTVTERAYAMQRGGSIVFSGRIYDSLEAVHPEIAGLMNQTGSTPPRRREALQHLARIFTYIDGDIVLCWNGQCGTECTRLTGQRARLILSELSGDAEQVFGITEAEITDSLTESQKVDLIITWQWLRNRIWRLAFTHGLVDTSSNRQDPLSVARPFQIAQMVCMWCETFSRDAMDQHGRGFTEKICDIASLLPKLLTPSTVDTIRHGMGGDVPDILRIIRRLCLVARNHCRSDLVAVDSILAELAVASKTLLIQS